MATWFTSDTHFGHKHILKYCKGRLKYCDDIQHMDKVIIKKWNSKVKPDDIVWHLGDVVFTGNTYAREILEKLNGRKRLVFGNHDYSRSAAKWEKMGFEIAVDSAQIRIDGKRVWLSHYPYREDLWRRILKKPYYDDRYAKIKLKDQGDWLLHGHIHEIWKRKDKMINVGIDANKLEPMAETAIIKMMRKIDKN